jgi:hypothetical protein
MAIMAKKVANAVVNIYKNIVLPPLFFNLSKPPRFAIAVNIVVKTKGTTSIFKSLTKITPINFISKAILGRYIPSKIPKMIEKRI